MLHNHVWANKRVNLELVFAADYDVFRFERYLSGCQAPEAQVEVRVRVFFGGEPSPSHFALLSLFVQNAIFAHTYLTTKA